jgi:ABC-type uncharacterized transport system auxiliary subunit
MMAPRSLCFTLLLCLALLISSCFATNEDDETERYYRVAIQTEKSDRPPMPITLVLREFEVDDLLDREGILHQTSDVERGYWTTHQWIEPVAGMVRSTIQGDLERSGRFTAVYLFENEPLADVVVNAEIHEFGEVDHEDGWYGVVDVTFEASRTRDGSLVWHSRIRHEEKAAKRTVAETVRALGRALGRASEELKAGITAGAR